jgi:hypothetical protein
LINDVELRIKDIGNQLKRLLNTIRSRKNMGLNKGASWNGSKVLKRLPIWSSHRQFMTNYCDSKTFAMRIKPSY